MGEGLAVQSFSDEDVFEGLFSIDTVSCSNTFNSFWTKRSYVNPQRDDPTTYLQYQRTQPTFSSPLVRVVLSPLPRPDRVVIEQSHTSYDTTASSHIETPHKPP